MTINQTARYQHRVTGVVQGVGFRPFIYGLAKRLKLTGFIYNDSQGVTIEIEGTVKQLAAFKAALFNETPPLAHIEQLITKVIPKLGDASFTIHHSQAESMAHTLISPDISVCDDCLQETFDTTNRRSGYPFTNCTNCGPRFTIIQDIPYDRPMTTMACFPMCPTCQAEYNDPLNRRFHAQPNACPVCGPQVTFQWVKERQDQFSISDGDFDESGELDTPIKQAQTVIQQGGIVAIKGVGGFHLACSANIDEAIQTLRQRKGRSDKPFAIMALDIKTVKQFAHVDSAEEHLLTSKERPIVLLRKKTDVTISDNHHHDKNSAYRRDSYLSHLVVPNNPYIGVMLPYTPLHYLLLTPSHAQNLPTNGLTAIVLTSGNYSNEPIIKDNDDALARLSTIADAFLLHNRDIHIQCDDSVIRLFQGVEFPIRRSRGYAPFPVKLPFTIPPILAVGGELKATFCLTQETHAFMSQHIGDMENLETLQAFEQTVAHFKALFRIEPQLIACDLHPGYLSSQWAKRTCQSPRNNLKLVKIQHHHAHIAAVMAEHGLDGTQPVIGFSFDGTGYGLDGAIWGGEVMVADYHQAHRVGHLQYMPLPGGDVAVKRPYRLALAYLWQAGIPWDAWLPSVSACPQQEQSIIQHQLTRNFNTIPTSSMGRLFDAVASLLGVCHTITYEGQAAIELETLADRSVEDAYPFELQTMKTELDDSSSQITITNHWHINPTPLLQAIITDLSKGIAKSTIAAKFHNAVAQVILQLSLTLRQQTKLNQVALSGGVFQNITLLTRTLNHLQTHQFEVLYHKIVPPNDGGLALGQAIIASQQAEFS